MQLDVAVEQESLKTFLRGKSGNSEGIGGEEVSGKTLSSLLPLQLSLYFA